MFRKFTTVLNWGIISAILLTSAVAFGQKRIEVHAEKPPVVLDEPQSSADYKPSQRQIGQLNESGTAVLAAKMWNAYTTQAAFTNQISHDPYSGAVAIVHRGDRANNTGSGFLWYAGTFDGGQSWLDVGPFNPVDNTTARHPNIKISNPNQATDPFDATIKPVMLTNSLEPTANWETIWSATDLQMYTGSTQWQGQFTNPTNVGWIVDAMGGTADGSRIFAVAADVDATAAVNDNYLFTSFDQGENWTTNLQLPSSWFGASFNGTFIDFSDDMNGVLGFEAIPADGTTDYDGFFTFGYLKTTDGGVTWDAEPTWVTAPNIVGLDTANVGSPNFTVDMVVDADNDPHFVATYVTTDTTAEIYEITFVDSLSSWAALEISPVNVTSYTLAGPSALVTLNESQLSRNLAGDKFYVSWIDSPNPTEGDSLPDIFVSRREADQAEWSPAENITNTRDQSEVFHNISDIASDGDQVHILYTLFGEDPLNGGLSDLEEAEIWYLQNQIVTGIDDEVASVVPSDFSLEQNFPNPFNPMTSIEFSLKKAANVSLDVFNLVGQKVTTLHSGQTAAGDYSVEFDASSLASGVYFYRLSASDFQITRKMVLMK